MGGAERVLKVFLEMFPDADLYTLLYDEEKTRGEFEDRIAGTSFLDCSLVTKHHRLFIPIMPFAAWLLRSKTEYDLVISSSAGYAKGFGIKGKRHICYCHTPLRYAWEREHINSLLFVPTIVKILLVYPISFFLRVWDRRTAKKPDAILANSRFIADKVRRYYKRDAKVAHPPTDSKVFYYKKSLSSGGRPEYYLMVGRLIHYKRFDLGIRACGRIGRELKIVGVGPQLNRLKKISDLKHVQFIFNAGDDELRALYANAKAFIFPQVEDFGLVAAEAQMCGCPVIAYGEGGSCEIVEDGKTGVFFMEQTVDSLVEAIRDFEGRDFDKTYISKFAMRFSGNGFRDTIRGIVARI